MVWRISVWLFGPIPASHGFSHEGQRHLKGMCLEKYLKVKSRLLV